MTFDFLTEPITPEFVNKRYMNKKGDALLIEKIAEDIINSLHIITMRDNEEMLHYQDGIYHSGGDIRIKEVMGQKMPHWLRGTTLREVMLSIQSRTYRSRDEIDTDKHLIHLKNGIYNLRTGEFGEFTPDILSTSKIPVEYDPDAECPAIDKFMSEVLSKADNDIIYELLGYCLYRAYPIQKAIIFVGGGRNGKSVLINLLTDFIGKSNISGQALQDLETKQFSTSHLFGKMVNAYPDLSSEGMKTTGVFKSLVGGDMIPAEKKFKQGFTFRNYAKLIFSCNTLPSTADDTDGYFRRWVIVNFPNKFEGDNDDKNIIHKITTPTELSGLFNRAVVELKALLDRGDFSNAETTEQTRDRYVRMSDSLRAFLTDYVEASSNNHIWKDELYGRYAEYCRDNNYPLNTTNMVTRRLPEFMRADLNKKTHYTGQKKAWCGIRWKDTDVPEDTGEMTHTDCMKAVRDCLREGDKTMNELTTKLNMIEDIKVDSILKKYLSEGDVMMWADKYQWVKG